MADNGTAARYHRIQLALSALGLAATLTYLVLVLATGASHAAAGWAARVSAAWWWQAPAVAAILGGAYQVLAFPLAWISGFLLPRRFGLLHQPLLAWFTDRAKAGAISAVLGLAAVEIVYGLMRALGAWWWLAAAGAFFAAYIVMTLLAPVWILPLFYRLTPLTDEALRTRMLALAARTGVPVVGVWIADQSRKSRTANAALVGLGRTRRIILFDTLVAEFAPREIESVLAHELGHHVHADMRRKTIVQGVLTLATFGIAALGLRAGVALWGLESPADPAGLPWLGLIVVVLGIVMLPLGNAFSRRVERQADDFALATTGDAPAFVAAMERLARLNLAERNPHRVKELFLYSHPAIDRRIARALGESRTAPARP